MAEEPDAKKLEITADQLNAVFDRLAGSKACPVCLTDDWWAHYGDDWTTSLPYTRPDGDLGFKGLPLVSILCKNCGYVRQHTLSAIKRLIEEGRS